MCDFSGLLTPSIYVAIIGQGRMSHLQLGSNGLQTRQVESGRNGPVTVRFEQGYKHDIMNNSLDIKQMFDFSPNFFLISA